MRCPGFCPSHPRVWGVSMPPLEAPHPSPGSGPLLCCPCAGVPDTLASEPLAQGLGRCPHSVQWLLLNLGSPLKGPLLGRPSLTPGTLRWSVFSFVPCPSTGLRSMRTSSPHLAPYCTPSSIARSQTALSTHLRAGRSTSGLMVVRTSPKALSQPPGAFPPPCPCAPAEGNRCSQILELEIPP